MKYKVIFFGGRTLRIIKENRVFFLSPRGIKKRLTRRYIEEIQKNIPYSDSGKMLEPPEQYIERMQKSGKPVKWYEV